MVSKRTSFKTRPMEALYFSFLLIHALATIFVDFQGLYIAKSISPPFLRGLFEFGAQYDPLLFNATQPSHAWFQSFLWLEVIFQLPLFLYGSYGLYQDDPPLILLTVYGTHAATTTFACIFQVLATPGIRPQLPRLLSSYVPFFIVPSVMALDFGSRINRRISGSNNELKDKRA